MRDIVDENVDVSDIESKITIMNDVMNESANVNKAGFKKRLISLIPPPSRKNDPPSPILSTVKVSHPI